MKWFVSALVCMLMFNASGQELAVHLGIDVSEIRGSTHRFMSPGFSGSVSFVSAGDLLNAYFGAGYARRPGVDTLGDLRLPGLVEVFLGVHRSLVEIEPGRIAAVIGWNVVIPNREWDFSGEPDFGPFLNLTMDLQRIQFQLRTLWDLDRFRPHAFIYSLGYRHPIGRTGRPAGVHPDQDPW